MKKFIAIAITKKIIAPDCPPIALPNKTIRSLYNVISFLIIFWGTGLGRP